MDFFLSSSSLKGLIYLSCPLQLWQGLSTFFSHYSSTILASVTIGHGLSPLVLSSIAELQPVRETKCVTSHWAMENCKQHAHYSVQHQPACCPSRMVRREIGLYGRAARLICKSKYKISSKIRLVPRLVTESIVKGFVVQTISPEQ